MTVSIIETSRVVNTFNNFIDKKRLRRTPERIAVLEMIYNKDEHFTVENLYLDMVNSNMRVSRATVYNTLQLLLECGLVNKLNIGNSSTYFEKAFGCPEHDHIICTNCNKIIDFRVRKMAEIRLSIERRLGIRILDHKLIFYAECLDENCPHKSGTKVHRVL